MNWTLEEIEDALRTLQTEQQAGALFDEAIIKRLLLFFDELIKDDPTLTPEHFWNVTEAVTGKRPDFAFPLGEPGDSETVGEWRTMKCQEGLASIIPSPLDRSLGSFRAFIRKEEEPL